MSVLPYFVATVSTLQSYGIDTDGLRKSLTGEIIVTGEGEEAVVTDTHKAIVHQHLLTPEQVRAIRFDADIEWYFGDEAVALVQGEEWAAESLV